jgi:hypothetical protein
MSEPENFVARWSRLKRQSDPKAAEDADQAPAAQPQSQGEEARIPAAQPPPPAFDPATLLSIESITAGTDIRAFLQSGVPAELTKAALRRVWTTDPAMRDFVGIAENQWDFTDPTAMPGFGPLEATDDVRKLVAQAMGRLGESAEQLAEDATSGDPAPASALRCSTDPTDAQPLASSIQASGIPAGNSSDPRTENAHVEQDQVVGATQHAGVPAERGPPPNRRPRGRALPK